MLDLKSLKKYQRSVLGTLGSRGVHFDSTNLVALYLFQRGTGTTLYDWSGNGYNGDISGPTWGWNADKKKQALDFDGSDDYVYGSALWFPNGYGGPMSAFLWLNVDSTSAEVAVNEGAHFFIRVIDGDFDADIDGITGNPAWGCPPSTGTWYFVGITWDGSTMYCYVNGDQVNSFSCSGTMGTAEDYWCLGRWFPTATSGIYDGRVCLLMVYKRLLSEDEIKSIYERTK